MKRTLHRAAGMLSTALIATFWLSTMISEIFLSRDAIWIVKNGIAYALFAFVPIMMVAGGSGFILGGKSTHPRIVAKRRRMPFIAMNGLLVLVPSAIFLADKANAGEFDALFYNVQVLELLAGAANLTLMGLNIRDGLHLLDGGVPSTHQKETSLESP
ncbi:MAG: hypothetical protein H7839_22810 [Magnetococcus sp. YQC-5]